MAAVTRLAIMRHATAVGHAATDWDRPLSDHGHVQAQDAGRWLRERGFTPTHAVVSSSMRTRQTFAELGFDLAVDLTDDAYNATGAELADLVEGCDPAGDMVLVVAHNPGVSDLARACGADRVLTPGSIVIVQWDGGVQDFRAAAVSVEGAFQPV